MATTEVELCNLALFKVRATEIGDLNEQSVNAEKCRVLYPQVRKTVLTDAVWGFAKSTRALSLTGNTPEEWEYEYNYPNDCLKLLYLVPPGVSKATVRHGLTLNNTEVEHLPYETMNNTSGDLVIATNQENAKAAFIKAVTDVRLFDAKFEEALILKLAAELAIPLGGDSGKKYRDDALRGYFDAIEVAKANSANEQWPRLKQQRPREIQARRAGVYTRTI